MPSVVFFQGAFASAQQVQRLTTHPDPLFQPHEIVPPPHDLPEIIYSPSIPCRALMWFANAFLLLLGRPGLHGDPYYIDVRRVNLAQQSDIEQCRERGVGDIAFGISRGAATTFARWAVDDIEHETEQPSFLLLEGCPASIPHAIRFRYGDRVASWIEWVLEHTTQYKAADARTLSPLALADRFPHTLPVAFVTAKHDTTVSPDDTHAIVAALLASGHPSVHVLELQDAHHNNYFVGSERDRHAYRAFVGNLKHLYLPKQFVG